MAMATSLLYTYFLSANDLAIYAICMSTIALPIAISDSVLGISSTITAPMYLKKINVSLYKFLIVNAIAAPFVIFSVIHIIESDVSSVSLTCILFCLSFRDAFIRIHTRDNTDKTMLKSGLYGILIIFFVTFLFIATGTLIDSSTALLVTSMIIFFPIVLSIKGKVRNLFDLSLQEFKKISNKEYFLVIDNIVSWCRFQAQLIIASFYFDLVVIASIFAARIMISPLLQINPILNSIILPRLTNGTKKHNGQFVFLLISLLILASIIYGIIIYNTVDYFDAIFRDINFTIMKDFLIQWFILGVLYLVTPILNTLYIAEMKIFNKLVYNMCSAVIGILLMCFFGWLQRHDLFLTGLIVAESVFLILLFNRRFL